MSYRSIDLSMPQLPLQGADFLIENDGFICPFVALARDMIGDLLEGLDFYSDVEPINDMLGWTWQIAR